MSAVAVPIMHRRAWRTLLRVKLALIDRRKYQRVALEDVCGVPVVVLPDVFNPKLLRSGEFLVLQLHSLAVGASLLDLGCGSGAAGIWAAARRGCRVTAVDINPSAVRCTRANALLNNVSVDVREGDLFSKLDGERFDVVLFNPPYYRGVPRDPLDHAWRSPDVSERFSAGLAAHLSPNGYALVVLSSDGERSGFLSSLSRNGLSYEVVARRDFINEVMFVYRVQPC